MAPTATPSAATVPTSIFLVSGGLTLPMLAVPVAATVERAVRLGVGGGGALGDLLLQQPDELLVRRPERLADADGVVDDLGDGGVPVAPLPVVEDAVAADHQVVAVAGGERGDDLHLLGGGRAGAVEVGEVGAGQAGHGGVLGGVVDRQAQVAGALVEVERAVLEDGRAAVVEVLEVDEVGAEAGQIAVVADQTLDLVDAGRLRLQRLVAGDERRHARRRRPRRGSPARARRRASRPAGPPSTASQASYGASLPPSASQSRFGELGARAEQRRDGVVAERPQRGRVGRVDRASQRQRPLGRGQRQRKPGDLVDGDRQVAGGDGEVLLRVAVQRRQRARIERRQPAAAEVVVDLGLDGGDGRGGGGRSFGAEGKHVGRALLAPGVPGAVGAGLGEERVGARAVDARLAGAIRHRADRVGDLADEGAGGVVLGGHLGDDPVAVEDGVGEDAGRIADVLEA